MSGELNPRIAGHLAQICDKAEQIGEKAAHLAQICDKAKRIGAKAEQIGDVDRSIGAYAVAMQGVREGLQARLAAAERRASALLREAQAYGTRRKMLSKAKVCSRARARAGC